MRVAVLGGLAFVLFAIVFFRLWFLQVLSGEDYVSQARDNRVRKVRIEAPRGDIVDRHGTTLVKTRVAPVVQIVPSSLPDSVLEQADEFRKARGVVEKSRLAAADRLRSLERDIREQRRGATRAQRRDRRRLARAARSAEPVPVPPVPVQEVELRRLYRRLGHVIDVRPKLIHERVIEGVAELPYSNVTIRSAVDRNAFNYIRERKEQFPGVAVEKQYLRDYPHKQLAAQLFGTTREISPKELKLARYRGVEPGTRIGADGIEESYDKYLRGKDGYTRVVINALGNRDDRRRMTRREPRQGQRLRLTLDLNLQRAANDALGRAVGAASVYGAKAGAFVAMDPRNGEILALGSYPSFDANEFAKPISQNRYRQLSSEERGAPLFNRAIAATYPTGSTFKPITAMAALEEGVITPSSTIVDDGEFDLGDRVLHNARDASYGALQLPGALTVSSDIFFYQLGLDMNGRGPVLQEWARRLGIGRRTGIDIPGEFAGLVPDSEWRDEGYKEYLRCAKKAKVEPGTTAALFECGGIERTWTRGRQRQPGGRPGRPAGDAAPARDRLLDDRQRRQGGAPAPRHARRGRQRRSAGGDPDARAPPRRVRSRPPRGDHGGPARRRHGRQRHVERRVRRLQVPQRHVRQDRHRRARAEPRPVVVRLLRRPPDQADRGRDHDRARRVRRRDRGTRGTPHPQ